MIVCFEKVAFYYADTKKFCCRHYSCLPATTGLKEISVCLLPAISESGMRPRDNVIKLFMDAIEHHMLDPGAGKQLS